MKKFGDFLKELFYPPKCAFCGKILRHVPPTGCMVCPSCSVSLPRPSPGDSRTGEGFKACYSALLYRSPVRESLLRYKFSSRRVYAKTYAFFLSNCIKESVREEFDIISFVPVSKKRRSQRGFDQSELLCRETARLLGISPMPVLIKTKHTKRQSGMPDYSAREKNIRGAYKALSPEKIKDKTILLIDDIITSGSTLSECAVTLRQAGAKEVIGLTLATK